MNLKEFRELSIGTLLVTIDGLSLSDLPRYEVK